jgi:lipoprotein Spr
MKLTSLFLALVALLIFLSTSANATTFDFYSKKTNEKITEDLVLKHYAQWEGVKYKFGGTGKAGIDCSAFIQKIYRNFDFHLPRTTKEQIKLGKDVRKHELELGDLVFFKTSKTSRHVGIYIGNQKFIHASSTFGVTTSNLNNSFWSKTYEKSKRIIT